MIESLLCLFFLLLSAALNASQMVLNRFRKGLYSHFDETLPKSAKRFQKARRLSLTLWIGDLFCHAGLIFAFTKIEMCVHPPLLSLTLGIVWALLLLILAGRIIPRFLVLLYPKRFFQGTAFFIACFEILLFPLIAPLSWLQRQGARIFGVEHEEEFLSSVTEDEIISVVEAGEKAGTLDTHEREMIQSVITFGDTIAREVMIPRTQIHAIPEGATLTEALDFIHITGYTRFPVFKNSIDNITGVLNVKDLLKHFTTPLEEKGLVEKIMQEPVFVPETKRIVELLSDLNKNHTHLAIVVDEYGGTSGLITLEDIVEEVVGEILDEYDTPTTPMVRKIDEHSYEVLAQMSIFDINEMLDIGIEESEEFDTIGGFLTTSFGKIPGKGEILKTPKALFTIVDADERRVLKVKIMLIKI
jgi:putative hemolysin